MKFFTNKTVENDYLLIKIQDYLKYPGSFKSWKEILIDPGVYELTKAKQYSWEKNIDIREFLNSLPKNHFFSADYPPDMNPRNMDIFLEQSWDHAIRYCDHPQYIVAVQFRCFHMKNKIIVDDYSFYEWFDRYNNLDIASNFMAIGNLSRQRRLTSAMKNIIHYTMKNSQCSRIHIYGLCLQGIEYAYKMAKIYNKHLSIDSTKWTHACTKELREHYGKLYCNYGWGQAKNKEDRQLFFTEYLKIIKQRCPGLQNDFIDVGGV